MALDYDDSGEYEKFNAGQTVSVGLGYQVINGLVEQPPHNVRRLFVEI